MQREKRGEYDATKLLREAVERARLTAKAIAEVADAYEGWTPREYRRWVTAGRE
jgi:hypothetical protein